VIGYLVRRVFTMLLTLIAVSAIIFVIINLPPGDALSNQIAELRSQGEDASIAQAEFLRQQYSLDQPLWKQYLIWVGVMPGPDGYSGLLQGDYGWSFEFDAPVAEILDDALWLTVAVNFAALLFIYVADYAIAIIGYIGLATPNFLLALLLLYYGQRYLGLPIGGLMAPAFEGEPMSWAKMTSILVHLIVPTIVIGTAGTAAMIRRLRANLLDELGKPYVETAKAKGLSATKRVIKYPLRAALNPFVADIGNLLPSLVSGSVLVSVVLSLPTLGPTLLDALRAQDQYLAGFILLFVSALTLIGMLLSDILLVILDPRIRFGGRGA